MLVGLVRNSAFEVCVFMSGKRDNRSSENAIVSAQPSWHAAPTDARDARIHELELRVADLEARCTALREVDQRKNLLLDVISHDLRNPLTPIRNSLYIMEHAAPGSDQARRAQAVVCRQVDHLASLLDDLLRVTRLTPDTIEEDLMPALRVRQRVLIIDANIDEANSLREVLELQGHEVALAYDGAGGLAKARQFRADVVLCDIDLPGMDGYALAQAFRADDALKSVHLLALSGYALPEDMQRAAEAGFDRHLAKPPNVETLKLVLHGLTVQ